MTNDTISDMLTRIRNSISRHKENVEMPYTKQNENILKVLKDLGYVEDYKNFKNKDVPFKSLNVILKYDDKNKSAISHLSRISKPGLRKYVKSSEIKPVLGGLGSSVISTPQGIMSGVEARKRKLGGEIICIVY